MKITINYFKKGKKQTRDIDIYFVPNHVYRETQYIIDSIVEASTKTEKLKQKKFDILVLQKAEVVDKNAIAQINKEIETIIEEIKDFENNDFFKRRFELIKFLLVKNGIEETDQLCSYSFWDEDVQPSEIIRILLKVVSESQGDEPVKKKIHS